jgi:hypothetical protein
MLSAAISSTGAAAAADILAAATGTRYVIHKIELTTTAAAAVKVHEGADSATSRLFYADLGANGGTVMEWDGGRVLATNTALKLTTDAGNCHGLVHYTKSQD